MVQLQLLDLMIRKESEAVPMDATARADLIDLMARVLVAVFQAEGGRVDDRALYSPKIKPEHLARKAIVYLRQSSEKQVRQNKESQRLQYEVAERVRALGWKQVEIINSDLGSSAGHGLRSAGRLRACPQFGGTRRGGNRRQPGGIAAIPHGQRLVSAAGGVPDFWNADR